MFTDVACKRFSCACPCVHGEARRCVGFRCNPVVPPCRRATRQRWPADGEAVNGPPAGTAIVDPFRVDDDTAVSASAQACTSTSYPQYTPTPYPVNGRSNTARLDAAYMNGLVRRLDRDKRLAVDVLKFERAVSVNAEQPPAARFVRQAAGACMVFHQPDGPDAAGVPADARPACAGPFTAVCVLCHRIPPCTQACS